MDSGDSGELLQQDLLAKCVEGQVPPDVGANGSNLGKVEKLSGQAGNQGKGSVSDDRNVSSAAPLDWICSVLLCQHADWRTDYDGGQCQRTS